MYLGELNHTRYQPSRLALGCEPLGGTDWGNVDISNVRQAVRYAYANGITTFDTADVYGLGRSEEELAVALGQDRHDAFIVTKFGVRWELHDNGRRATTYKDLRPDYIEKALEASLRRLKLEAIPLYLVHWPDGHTPIEDVLAKLVKFVESGKILNYGLSNFSLEEFGLASQEYPIHALECQYNLIDRRNLDAIKFAKGLKAATFAYGPLAQGLLTGKYSEATQFSDNDRRHRLESFQQINWDAFERLRSELDMLASSLQCSTSQVALAWILSDVTVDCVIVGAKNPEQVGVNIGALDIQIAKADQHNLETLASEVFSVNQDV